CQQEGNWPTF
nr:immunoglobulin light chain junction region [Macaca mulatta]